MSAHEAYALDQRAIVARVGAGLSGCGGKGRQRARQGLGGWKLKATKKATAELHQGGNFGVSINTAVRILGRSAVQVRVTCEVFAHQLLGRALTMDLITEAEKKFRGDLDAHLVAERMLTYAGEMRKVTVGGYDHGRNR